MRRLRRLSVALVLTALVGCGDSAEEPTDSALLPLPDGLTLLADSGADCGAGGDYHCDRAWLVVGPSSMSAADVSTALLQHLQQEKGWPQEVSEADGMKSVSLPERRHGYLSPFGETFDADNFADAPGRTTPVVKPLARADEDAARANGVVVVVDDCCGDGF